MSEEWKKEDLLGTARAYQQACVLLAGAELGLFDALAEMPPTAAELAAKVRASKTNDSRCVPGHAD